MAIDRIHIVRWPGQKREPGEFATFGVGILFFFFFFHSPNNRTSSVEFKLNDWSGLFSGVRSLTDSSNGATLLRIMTGTYDLHGKRLKVDFASMESKAILALGSTSALDSGALGGCAVNHESDFEWFYFFYLIFYDVQIRNQRNYLDVAKYRNPQPQDSGKLVVPIVHIQL